MALFNWTFRAHFRLNAVNQSMIGWRVRAKPSGPSPQQLSREWVPSRRLGWQEEQASIQGEDMPAKLDKHAFPVNKSRRGGSVAGT